MNLDGIIEDLPSKNTPLCKSAFEKMCNAMLDKVYPIGISIMFHDNEDHSNFLGLTWERDLEGLMPVGYNQNDSDFNTIDNTGGEKTHKLTVQEMPSHTHKVYDGHYGDDREIPICTPNSGAGGNYPAARGGTSNDTQAQFKNSSTGGDQPHNNMPPYKVVAFWKRVA